MLQKRGRINRNCRGSDKSLPLTIIVIDKLPHGSMGCLLARPITNTMLKHSGSAPRQGAESPDERDQLILRLERLCW